VKEDPHINMTVTISGQPMRDEPWRSITFDFVPCPSSDHSDCLERVRAALTILQGHLGTFRYKADGLDAPVPCAFRRFPAGRAATGEGGD
jgi:hypothetical protein